MSSTSASDPFLIASRIISRFSFSSSNWRYRVSSPLRRCHIDVIAAKWCYRTIYSYHMMAFRRHTAGIVFSQYPTSNNTTTPGLDGARDFGSRTGKIPKMPNFIVPDVTYLSDLRLRQGCMRWRCIVAYLMWTTHHLLLATLKIPGSILGTSRRRLFAWDMARREMGYKDAGLRRDSASPGW